MQSKNRLTLRCFVKREDSHWVAVCIDLSLAAQADSSKEAVSKLESMIVTYVKDAYGRHKEHANQLLSRKAPFSQFVTYYFAFLSFRIRRLLSSVCNGNGGDYNRVFEEHYPGQTV